MEKFYCENLIENETCFPSNRFFFIVLWGGTATPLTLNKPNTSSAKPHLQAGSPVVMEMQIPTVLSWWVKVSWARLADVIEKCHQSVTDFSINAFGPHIKILLFVYLQMKKLARRQQQQQEQHNSQRLGQGEDLSSVCVHMCVYTLCLQTFFSEVAKRKV